LVVVPQVDIAISNECVVDGDFRIEKREQLQYKKSHHHHHRPDRILDRPGLTILGGLSFCAIESEKHFRLLPRQADGYVPNRSARYLSSNAGG
jgi:hypothetical protein